VIAASSGAHKCTASCKEWHSLVSPQFNAARQLLNAAADKFGAMTVWQEFTPLAKETGAVNLGQGFPDWEAPRFVKDAMIRAVNENHNQYARSAGHPPLVQAIAQRCVRQHGALCRLRGR